MRLLSTSLKKEKKDFSGFSYLKWLNTYEIGNILNQLIMIRLLRLNNDLI